METTQQQGPDALMFPCRLDVPMCTHGNLANTRDLQLSQETITLIQARARLADIIGDVYGILEAHDMEQGKNNLWDRLSALAADTDRELAHIMADFSTFLLWETDFQRL